jgi:hypothetical protein
MHTHAFAVYARFSPSEQLCVRTGGSNREERVVDLSVARHA